MSNDDTRTSVPTTFSPFAPILLAMLGLIVLLAWNLRGVILQSANLQTAKFQVWQATLQSAQTEAKLQAMLTDLIALGAEDPAAAAIVKRYGIKQNAPVVPAPQTKPEAKAGEK